MSDSEPADTSPSGAPSNQKLTWAALAIACVALAISVAPVLTGGFDDRVRTYLLAHPEVLQEVSAALQSKQDLARADVVRERVQANPTLLRADLRDPAFGPADARVTVVEFFDFRCPGCKQTAPEVMRLMQAHPDVRFVFKDWPILDQGGEDLSHYAARAALAAHEQGLYLPVFQSLMATPSLDQPAIDEVLAANGVDMARARAAMSSAAVARHLADIHTAGATLQLVGTPTFFVNGAPQASIAPAALDQAIRAAKAGA